MKNKSSVYIIITALMLLVSKGFTQEPLAPNVDTSFSAEKEAQIQKLSVLSIKDAVEQLKGVEFITDEAYLNRAIFIAFQDRKGEAIAFALEGLKLPAVEVSGGRKVNRAADIFVLKKILQVFPEDSIAQIVRVYAVSTAAAKSNFLQALGNLAGEEARNMLISALDDKAFCQEVTSEMDGEPMRVCDVAYNQLVLRYQAKDVLRTIGPAHSLEIRDYHIEILKGKI